MVVASRVVVALGLAGGLVVQGLRKSSRDDPADPEAKFVAGVPILNYHLAYEGGAILADGTGGALKQDWNIVLDSSSTDEQIHKLCQLGECKAEGHPSKGGVPFFEISATEADLEKILHSAGGVVEYVEPDTMVHLAPLVETEQQTSTYLWGQERIGTPQRSSTGKGTHIYVIDTGIRKSHSDFGGRAIATFDTTQWFNKKCSSWSLPDCGNDRNGHGTHCAATAAGAKYGVAPAAALYAVKVLGNDGGGSMASIYDGLDHVATESVRPAVASISLGVKKRIKAMRTAVDAVTSAGVTVVVAAGNEDVNACNVSPAYVPSAICVGSTDAGDRRSSFSNFGFCVGIWAPGRNIRSAGIGSDTESKTYSGTSMACPHVSGAAALVLEKDPSTSPMDVYWTLHDRAESDIVTNLPDGSWVSHHNEFLNVSGL